MRRRRSSGWPAPGWGSRCARTCGSPMARWRRRAGPARTWWSTSTPRPTTADGAWSGWRCCTGGWPRRDAPSPTSTRSAARTSWSSTATRSSWRPTARSWPPGPSSPPIWWWWTSPSAGDRAHRRHGAAPGGRHRSPPGAAVSAAPLRPPARPELSPEAEVYAALVLGTRDYLGKNGFSEAVIGLSGGIDSSLVATVAVDALGPSHVHGISMPSRYSSDGSRHDAEALAARLGIDLRVVPIEEAHVAFTDMLAGVLGREPTGLTDENLQSRLRGVLLMGVSNAKGWIVLTTGNKSEMATGYSTLYGDSAGGFAVIKDVPKTLVYDLCRYRNAQAVREGLPGPIPDSVLDKAPSAELRPDQRDDQSLPPVRGARPGPAGLRGGGPDGVGPGGPRVRSGGGRAGRPLGGRGRVQAAADASGRAHHDQGLRQGPAHADHQPLPSPAPRRAAPWLKAWSRPPPAPTTAFRSIDELAELCGHYCWVERRHLRGDRESGQSSRLRRDRSRRSRSPRRPQRDVGRATASWRRSGATACRCGPASMPGRSSSPRPVRSARRST